MKKIYLFVDLGCGFLKPSEAEYTGTNSQFAVPIDENCNLYDSYLCCFVQNKQRYSIVFTPKNSGLLVGNFKNIPYYFAVDKFTNPMPYVGNEEFEDSKSLFLTVFPEFDGLIVHQKELLYM